MSAGVAGLCFGACILIVALAYVSALFRIHGPAMREWLLWLMSPQFGMGMLAAFLLIAAWLCLFAWAERSPR